MIRLSKSSDYGLMAMRDLAYLPKGCCRSARDIAAEHRIPRALMAKLLQRLAHHGLVAATHGIKGGYRIARPAGSISLCEVIEAIDGPLAMTDCHDPCKGECPQEDACTVKDPLAVLQGRIVEILVRTKVSDLGSAPDPPARVRA
jgi:Rrf2 family protein